MVLTTQQRKGKQVGRSLKKNVVWSVDEEKHYQVYRFIHPGETDHAGNREWRGGILATKAEAQELADELNDAGR